MKIFCSEVNERNMCYWNSEEHINLEIMWNSRKSTDLAVAKKCRKNVEEQLISFILVLMEHTLVRLSEDLSLETTDSPVLFAENEDDIFSSS